MLSILVIEWIGTWGGLLSGCNAGMHLGSGGCAVEMQMFNMLVLLMMLVIRDERPAPHDPGPREKGCPGPKSFQECLAPKQKKAASCIPAGDNNDGHCLHFVHH